MIRKWIKKTKDNRELKKSNWGRKFGWYIEYHGENIGELIDYQWNDMFWDSYIIKSLDDKWNPSLEDAGSWIDFKFKNKYYDLYADAIPEDRVVYRVILNQRVKMRGLYLNKLH